MTTRKTSYAKTRILKRETYKNVFLGILVANKKRVGLMSGAKHPFKENSIRKPVQIKYRKPMVKTLKDLRKSDSIPEFEFELTQSKEDVETFERPPGAVVGEFLQHAPFSDITNQIAQTRAINGMRRFRLYVYYFLQIEIL